MTLATILSSVVILFMPLGQGECDSNTGGYYDTITNDIYICTPLDKNYRFYLYHEIGHYIWDNRMNIFQKMEYKKMYVKAKSFYRDYGLTDMEEDFADNFALMIERKKVKSLQLQYRINYIGTIFKNL